MTNIEPIPWKNENGDWKWQPRIDNEKYWYRFHVLGSYAWYNDEEAYEDDGILHPELYRFKDIAEHVSKRELKRREKRKRKGNAAERKRFKIANPPDPRHEKPKRDEEA